MTNIPPGLTGIPITALAKHREVLQSVTYKSSTVAASALTRTLIFVSSLFGGIVYARTSGTVPPFDHLTKNAIRVNWFRLTPSDLGGRMSAIDRSSLNSLFHRPTV